MSKWSLFKAAARFGSSLTLDTTDICWATYFIAQPSKWRTCTHITYTHHPFKNRVIPKRPSVCSGCERFIDPALFLFCRNKNIWSHQIDAISIRLDFNRISGWLRKESNWSNSFAFYQFYIWVFGTKRKRRSTSSRRPQCTQVCIY